MNFNKLTLILSLLLLYSIPISAQETDTLTAQLCSHPEQIFTKPSSTYRIDYWMGETMLNMRTTKGFLYNNGASRPFLQKYTALKVTGYTLTAAGAGLIITNIALKKPGFSPIGIAGYTSIVCGLTATFSANGKFRMAVYQYNRNICGKK
ncbi:MAG: hypothetical protein GX556_12755 [Fibrobacter sp.]|nr:hypothetical protein [Fibrobacter sp.]